MKVIWIPDAEQDRADVWDQKLAEHPAAAIRMLPLFSDAAKRPFQDARCNKRILEQNPQAVMWSDWKEHISRRIDQK